MFRGAVVASILLIALATSQPIPPAPMETVWEGMFAPPYLQSPQIALAMDCVSSSSCYIAGASNGIGAGVYIYNGEFIDANVTGPMNMPNMSMIVTDLVVGGPAANPIGAFTGVVDFTIGAGLQYLTNQGTEWLPSQMPWELVWAGEGITANEDMSLIVATGAGISGNGFMVSTDGGKTFSPENINYSPEAGDNCSGPGALAMPSSDVWYLLWGNEPPQNNSQYFDAATEQIVATKAHGQVLVIRNLETKKIRTYTKTVRQLYADRKAARKAAGHHTHAPGDCNYYSGWILKSTDQGGSWQVAWTAPVEALTSTITCYDANHCIVIAFNDEFSYTVTTVDGATWAITYTSPVPSQTEAISVQAAGYYNQTEVWVAGSEDSQQAGQGMFWSSTNSGKTWSPYLHYIPDVMAIMQIDFVDNVGFAVGVTAFQTSQIMRYKRQADYGDFIQVQCPLAGCSILCQNVTFPQGVCLQTNDGSAKAFCTSSGVTQYAYQTTSCVGGYQTYNMPVNQCLNGTTVFFENLCPPSGKSRNTRPHTNSDRLFH